MTILPGAQKMNVAERFGKFLDNIALTDKQIEDGRRMRENVVQILNREYYNSNHPTNNSIFIDLGQRTQKYALRVTLMLRSHCRGWCTEDSRIDLEIYNLSYCKRYGCV